MYEILVFGSIGLPIIGALVLFVVSFITPWTRRTRSDFFQPKFLYHPSGVYNQQFPCLLRTDTKEWKGPQHTKAEVYLSVIVPAMNEEERLPIMLDHCLDYLEERKAKDPKFTYEVIVVDDGSKDRTADVAFEYGKKYVGETVRVLKLAQNVGKGGAVRNGVLCARGQLILFADADDATKFSDVFRLEKEMVRLCNGEGFRNDKDIVDWTHPAVVVGSRAHLEKESIAERSLFRTILMVGFHMVVYVFAVRGVRDTQCGFKMFSRAAAAKLFPQIHIERWAFDVELLYLAERFNIPIAEIAVEWHEVAGSKITPILSWIQMGRDIVLIWFRYTVQLWKDNDLKL